MPDRSGDARIGGGDGTIPPVSARSHFPVLRTVGVEALL